jgi:hypothetical protein
MKTKMPAVKLPEGILAHDLKYPDFKNKKDGQYFPDYDDKNFPYEDRQFELWNVANFGWCIPTLHIRNAGRRALASGSVAAPRTYAIEINTGKVCRIGLGPHVTARVTVYVRKNRRDVLQKFLDLRKTGSESANQIRDRISSRRAQGALYRMNRGW